MSSGLPPLEVLNIKLILLPRAVIPNRPAQKSNLEKTTSKASEGIEEQRAREGKHESMCGASIICPKKDGTWRMCFDCGRSTT